MKTIGILTNYLPEVSFDYDIDENYIRSQILLQETFLKKGLDIVRVAPNCYSQEKICFTRFGSYGLDRYEITQQEVLPMMIRNRSMHIAGLNYLFEDMLIFPRLAISELSSDKYQQYTAFANFQPYTILLDDFFCFSGEQDKFSNYVVLKPRFGSGGEGVELIEKKSLLENKTLYEEKKKMFLVQEYLDFSGGIPGIVDGIHDFRVVLLDGLPEYVTIRSPTNKNEFRSNMSLGGTSDVYDVSIIPESLTTILGEVMRIIGGKELSFCSCDFGYANDRWYLIEINGSPGIEFSPHDTKKQIGIYNTLAEYFLALQP